MQRSSSYAIERDRGPGPSRVARWGQSRATRVLLRVQELGLTPSALPQVRPVVVLCGKSIHGDRLSMTLGADGVELSASPAAGRWPRNFGRSMTKSPAAWRYTESAGPDRQRGPLDEFRAIRRFGPNFDAFPAGAHVLLRPAAFLLLNGCTGLAWAWATSIPPTTGRGGGGPDRHASQPRVA